jgi:hypothetical protein
LVCFASLIHSSSICWASSRVGAIIIAKMKTKRKYEKSTISWELHNVNINYC